jgi:hypothetical protein
MGMMLTVAVELCHVRGLPFAVGVYLPLSTSAPIFVGGMIRLLVNRVSRSRNLPEEESGPGMLFASGLIAGGAVAGLLLAAMSGIGSGLDPLTGKSLTVADKIALGEKWLGGSFFSGDVFSICVFAALAAGLGYFAVGRRNKR